MMSEMAGIETDLECVIHRAGRRYQLKTPYRDGTTNAVLEPLDFFARRAAWFTSSHNNKGTAP